MFTAKPCQCGDSICKHWHVHPVAAMQGVSFTEEQAKAVANFLNGTDHREVLQDLFDNAPDPTGYDTKLPGYCKAWLRTHEVLSS